MFWPAAIVLWVAGMFVLVSPGSAASTSIQFGDVQFNIGQLLIFLSVAFAWADSRAFQRENRKRIRRIEKHLFEDEMD